MKTLVFATSNQHKIAELRNICPDYNILGLKDLGFDVEIEETGLTLEENALLKAEFLFDKIGQPVLSEDTGLEVEALGGAPGVHTARYAGEMRDAEANMAKLLHELGDRPDRKAAFRTIIALRHHDGTELFEGIVHGRIASVKSGSQGFGYDPVFIPEGHDQTFAELPASVKNQMSHRARAVHKVIRFLQENSYFQ
jgi:XTP/dITP diphosphohydrolase